MNDFFLYLPDFARALGVTLGISMSAALIGAGAGFMLQALCRHHSWLYWPWRTYVWIIRGTPIWHSWRCSILGCPPLV